MNYKKKIVIILSVLVLAFIVGSIFITKSENKYVKKITLLIPTNIKSFVRDTVFIIPKHFREFNFLKSKTSRLQSRIYNLEEENKAIKASLFAGQKTSEQIISSKNNKKFYLKVFQLPWGNFFASDPKQRTNHKRHGYLDKHLDDIYVVFFSGKILKFNKNDINNNFLDTEVIGSNILDYLKNADQLWVGVKDILIIKNDIYISYTKAIGDLNNACYNTSVLKGTLGSDNINFEEFFTHDDCSNWDKKEGPAQAGGRMIEFKNNIFLTIGDFKNLELYSTVENRLFCKIISIDIDTKKYKIISKGHRNPQGLLYIENKDLIISSEHGPKGGDEINRILIDAKEIPHYGWPIASYGTFYGFESTEIRKHIIKYKNHEENGFVEPILVYEPAIGPSQIVQANYKSDNSYLVSSLSRKSLYEFDYSKKISKIFID
jgi:hypothetical protein